jgi:hypothetical protein
MFRFPDNVKLCYLTRFEGWQPLYREHEISILSMRMITIMLNNDLKALRWTTSDGYEYSAKLKTKE